MALEYDYTIDYNEQMLNYYPEIIKAIREFRALIETQSLQVQEMHDELNKILANAYVCDADENRISQWEQLLGIVPHPQGENSAKTWLEDRKETILARLYNVQKLNSKAIADVVSIFTNSTAKSYFKDGTIYIEVAPPPTDKTYNLDNIKQELRYKVPAHLSLQVDRAFQTWREVNDSHLNWKQVGVNYNTWNDVLYKIVSKPNKLDITTLDEFYLG